MIAWTTNVSHVFFITSSHPQIGLKMQMCLKPLVCFLYIFSFTHTDYYHSYTMFMGTKFNRHSEATITHSKHGHHATHDGNEAPAGHDSDNMPPQCDTSTTRNNNKSPTTCHYGNMPGQSLWTWRGQVFIFLDNETFVSYYIWLNKRRMNLGCFSGHNFPIT